MKTDLIIAGDGITAKVMHLAALKTGLSAMRVSKPAPQFANDPRSYAIAPSSTALFSALGLDLYGDQVKAIELGFGQALTSPLARLENTSGAMMHMLDHREIVEALDQQLPSAIDPKNERPEFGEFGVHYGGVDAPLLIFAEGKQSALAAHLGVSYQGHDYHARAITAKFESEIPHHQIARQLFANEGPIGVLPHQENLISIVWSAKEEFAQSLLAVDDQSFTSLLAGRISSHYGALKMVAPRASFPLQHQKATRLYGERFAFIGDSAHAVHPLAGQGLNLGLRDVAVMAEILAQAKRRGEDLGRKDQLAAYAHWRRGDIAQITHLTRGVDEFLIGEGLGQRAARSVARAGLALPLVSNWLARASDFALEPAPKLLEGQLP